MDAVAALRNLVDAFHADDLHSIKPLVPSLLNQLFALMAEVGTPFFWEMWKCLAQSSAAVLTPPEVGQHQTAGHAVQLFCFQELT